MNIEISATFTYYHKLDPLDCTDGSFSFKGETATIEEAFKVFFEQLHQKYDAQRIVDMKISSTSYNPKTLPILKAKLGIS